MCVAQTFHKRHRVTESSSHETLDSVWNFYFSQETVHCFVCPDQLRFIQTDLISSYRLYFFTQVLKIFS